MWKPGVYINLGLDAVLLSQNLLIDEGLIAQHVQSADLDIHGRMVVVAIRVE